jgi:hypothetical protein
VRAAIRNGAHLAVLSAFALAQPLLDLLGRNPAFFAVRRASTSEIVLFALAVTLVPPAVLLGVELLVWRFSARAAHLLQLVFVAMLTAVVALHVLTKAAASGDGTFVAAAAIGVAAALLYGRVEPAASFLTLLAPAPLVFVALFLFSSGTSKLVFVHAGHVAAPATTSTTPVVMIVFDEFSPVALMGRDERIDRLRYPGFAALAREATWYRSATTVEWLSEVAVPAVLTGIRPDSRLLPIYADHPRNIFTLFARGYRVRAVESLTQLCPPYLCPESSQVIANSAGSLASDTAVVYLHLVLPRPYSERLPAIDDSWGNFGHAEPTEEGTSKPCARNVCRFASLFSRKGNRTLYALHSLLPHVPYLYLPSGRRYAVEAPVLRGLKNGRWMQRWPSVQSYQRYLLQVEYTDRALEFILRRLRATGLYDKSLVVVTADHGVSFRYGQYRRYPTRRNLQDIAFVPLFVKLPFQRRGRIDDGLARTIDVVPTIARVLGERTPWAVDGRPLVGRRLPEDGIVSVLVANGKYASARLSALRVLRARALAEQSIVFGRTPADLYRIGPHRELLGRPVAQLAVRRSPTAAVELQDAALLSHVDRSSGLVPAYLEGRLSGSVGPDEDLAVTVNGRVAAVTKTFVQEKRVRFAAMVPEHVIRDGRNEVRVFRIRRHGGGPALEELAGSGRPTRLRRTQGQEAIVARRDRTPVEPGRLRGEVQVERKEGLYVFGGWASDPRDSQDRVDRIAVFVDGEQVFVARAPTLRPHTTLGQSKLDAPAPRLAFSFELPRSLLPPAGSGRHVRVLALSDGVASDLRYVGDWGWTH